MGHRGISSRAPDFDTKKLQGASNQVGFLGTPRSGVGFAIVVCMILAGVLLYFK